MGLFWEGAGCFGDDVVLVVLMLLLGWILGVVVVVGVVVVALPFLKLDFVHFVVVILDTFDDDVEVVEVVVLWLLLWHVVDELVVWKLCE